MDPNKKKELVQRFLEKGMLVSTEMLESLDTLPSIDELTDSLSSTVLVLQKEFIPPEPMNGVEQDKAIEKRDIEKKMISPLKLVANYADEPEKREVGHFVDYFNIRYKGMEKLLKGRGELVNTLSISRVKKKREKETLSVIGMVISKDTTKSGNLLITLEDPTGSLKVLISKNKPELFSSARDIVLDETIGVVGVNGENILFVNEVVWPDVPLTKELKKSPHEGYALFLSDIHIGSKNFLEKDFQKFTSWLSGKVGNDHQKEMAAKVSYIFIVGDLVDGSGIYPGQEQDLEIKNISEQYQKAAELLKEIPSHLPIIICPGNHDAVRLSEPQPPFYKDFAAGLYDMPNVVLVSNPSIVNIHATESFPGFDVLLYHGYSFDYFIANVDTIRNNGGYDRADLLMKFLLQRRHLAPSHTSTLYIPDTKKDPLIIESIPDFFVTGHIHKSLAATYRNITLINCSCWQSITDYMEKRGHVPQPSRVAAVNLQTRETKILRFGE